MRHIRQRSKRFHPVKRPGAATRKAHRAGESLSKWARKNYDAPGVKGKEARFVEISRKWHHGKDRKV
jgi:hypothetical protein